MTLGSNTWRQGARGPMMTGRANADTIPTGRMQTFTGAVPARPPIKYPIRGQLSAVEREVLELIRHRPRDLKEASDALAIGEWSIVRAALDHLVNRSLAEEVRGYPTTWRAL